MAKSSRQYWLDRTKEHENWTEQQIKNAEKEIQKGFEEAYEKLESQINKFYNKYADNGKIELSWALQRLTPSELQEARLEFMKLSKTASFSEEKEYLEKLSQRIQISRLEQLQANAQHIITENAYRLNANISETLSGIYKQRFSSRIEDIENPAGFKLDLERPSPTQLKATIHSGYDGRDYSPKIWYDRDTLAIKINQLMPQQFLTGKSSQKLAKELSNAMNAPLYNAMRIVRTEGTHMASQADLNFYEQAGITEYEFLATLDSRTSKICSEFDGKNFKTKDAQAGINLPPMHPNCRSATIPVVDMEDIEETRLAKDENGNYITVSGETNAEEYNELFTKDISNDTIKDISYKNKDEAIVEISKDSQKWLNNISYDEHNAVKAYSHTLYEVLNNYHRGLPNDYSMAEVVTKELDSAINKFSLSNNITVVRGVSSKDIMSLYPDATKISDVMGKIYTDPAYTSTSLDYNIAKKFASNKVKYTNNKPIVLSFEVPAGIGNAAYVDNISVNRGECELLIKRNAKFIIYDKAMIKDSYGDEIIMLKTRWQDD